MRERKLDIPADLLLMTNESLLVDELMMGSISFFFYNGSINPLCFSELTGNLWRNASAP